MKVSGEYLTFPGGGTQFIHGASGYINLIEQVRFVIFTCCILISPSLTLTFSTANKFAFLIQSPFVRNKGFDKTDCTAFFFFVFFVDIEGIQILPD